MDKKRIVIIIGAARSGSTLLAKAIGAHSKCFTLGEINRFNQEIENPETHCGCGELLKDCDFWQRNLKDLKIEFGKDNKVKNNFEVGIFKQMTRPSKLLKLLPTIVFMQPYRSDLIKKELHNSFKLYDQLFVKTQAHTLIDSTKGLFRALILESRFKDQFEFTFVHLLRDGRGVLNSEMKSSYKLLHKDGSLKEYEGRKNKSHHPAINSWLYINLRNFLVLKLFRKKNTFFLKYEDFTAEPEKWLDAIYSKLDLIYEPSVLNLGEHENHILGGNASRMNAKKINKSDEGWKTNLDKTALKSFNRKAGWFNKLIGY